MLPIGKATQPGVAGLSHWLIVSIISQPKGGCDMRSGRREGCHLRRKSRGSDLDTALVSVSATHQQTSCSIKLPNALSVEHDKTPNEHLISSPPGHHRVGRITQLQTEPSDRLPIEPLSSHSRYSDPPQTRSNVLLIR
jgi:hypothetical protein